MPRQYTPWVQLNCARCGAPFSVKPSRAARARFCSFACYHAQTPVEERFWKHVVKTDTCWLWQKGTSTRYGKINIGPTTLSAHRTAWELVAGPVPDELLVCHTCDNPACVRNDDVGTYELNGVLHPRRGHLWLGTHADNKADCVAKGRAPIEEKHWTRLHPERVAHGETSGPYLHSERMARGERNAKAKLTAVTVREIRAKHANGVSSAALAREYSVGKSQVLRIVRRLAWQHIE